MRDPPRPARAETTVRNAVAVRPPRPMTLPRSSGWTRTSSSGPRRVCLSRTVTSSGWSTTPRTRCSSASASTGSGLVGLGVGVRLGGLRGLRHVGSPLRGLVGRDRSGFLGDRRLGRGLLGRRLDLLLGGSLGLVLGGLLGGLLGRLAGHGLALGLAGGVLECLVEDLELVALGLGHLEGALGATDALERLPVTGDLEELGARVGRLRTDTEPVLGPVGDDRDVGRVLLGVVLADLLEHLAVALLARVDDDDAVVRRTDLAHALETNLDGHGCGVSSKACQWVRVAHLVGTRALRLGGLQRLG